MSEKNLYDIGDEIKDIVQNALNTKDFHQLNKDISNTVNNALKEVRGTFHLNNNVFPNNTTHQQSSKQTHNTYNKAEKAYKQTQAQYGQRNSQFQSTVYQPTAHQPVKKYYSPQLSVPVGRVSGTLLTVFGGIGIGLFSIAILVFLILAGAIGLYPVFGSIALGLLPLWIGSFLLTTNGNRIRKRLHRFQRYLTTFQGRKYCTINDLAANTGQSPKYVIKDLIKMKQKGMFPQGQFDTKKTCFILDRETYQQYLQLENQTRINVAQQQEAQQTPSNGAKTENPIHIKAVEEGKAYIRQIRRANDLIPGEEISIKLDRMEHVTDRIFSYIETHPNQVSDIEKFLKYYLPTTVKLLDAYIQFDQQPIQGDNIATGKREIENTLDTINVAFERLLDSLFESTAMDVSTDISVLETLLAQEGLTGNVFQKQ